MTRFETGCVNQHPILTHGTISNADEAALVIKPFVPPTAPMICCRSD